MIGLLILSMFVNAFFFWWITSEIECVREEQSEILGKANVMLDFMKQEWRAEVNIKEFKITTICAFGDWVYVEVNYPGCANYEGNKILVYYKVKPADISNAKEIDPHFSNTNAIKPIARFEPTEYGKLLALHLVKSQGDFAE